MPQMTAHSWDFYRFQLGDLVKSRDVEDEDLTGVIVEIAGTRDPSYQVHWSGDGAYPGRLYSWVDLAPVDQAEFDTWQEALSSWFSYAQQRLELIREESDSRRDNQLRDWKQLTQRVTQSIDSFERSVHAADDSLHWDGQWWTVMSAPLKLEYRRAAAAERKLATLRWGDTFEEG